MISISDKDTRLSKQCFAYIDKRLSIIEEDEEVSSSPFKGVTYPDVLFPIFNMQVSVIQAEYLDDIHVDVNVDELFSNKDEKLRDTINQEPRPAMQAPPKVPKVLFSAFAQEKKDMNDSHKNKDEPGIDEDVNIIPEDMPDIAEMTDFSLSDEAKEAREAMQNDIPDDFHEGIPEDVMSSIPDFHDDVPDDMQENTDGMPDINEIRELVSDIKVSSLSDEIADLITNEVDNSDNTSF
ncbi:hypothetical protein [Komagataeibacter nataicola]|nr:hypothetical protein [Komagataeibacter nataicola]GBR23526.1 hypothetical protein AA0616_2544 [Komagataeibacter nataicola NRIC 0616]